MAQLERLLICLFHVHVLQVSKMERCKVNPKKWKLYEYNNFLGDYDIVVIAHNGKCADRLLSTSGTVN